MGTAARDRMVPALVVLVMFSGFIKASPAMAWMPTDLTVGSLVMLCIAAAGRLLGEGLRLPTGVVPLIALSAVLAIPALYAPATAAGDEKMLRLFGITLLSALAAAIVVADRTERGWWFVYWTALGALGIAALLHIAPSTDTLYGRLALEGSNTIAIGRSAGAGLLALWLIARARRLRWIVALPAIVLLTAVLVGSGSRGPLIAVVIAATVVVVLRPTRHRLRELLVLSVAGGVLAAWALSRASDLATLRILSLFSSDDRGASVNVRLSLFDRSLELASDNPFGLGWYGLAPYLHPAAEYPHNLLLEVFAEAGWIPGIVLLAVGFTAMRRTFKAGDVGAAVGGLLVFWIVNAMVSGDINDNRTLFATLGIALVAPTLVRPAKCRQFTTNPSPGPNGVWAERRQGAAEPAARFNQAVARRARSSRRC